MLRTALSAPVTTRSFARGGRSRELLRFDRHSRWQDNDPEGLPRRRSRPSPFDSVEDDADTNVLYLSVGEPCMPAESFGTPEGPNMRYDETGAVIAIMIVNAKWLLERDGDIKLTIPSRVPAADLAPALAS